MEFFPCNEHPNNDRFGTHADAMIGEFPPSLIDKPDLGRGRFSPLCFTKEESTQEKQDPLYGTRCMEACSKMGDVYSGYAPIDGLKEQGGSCHRTNSVLSKPTFEQDTEVQGHGKHSFSSYWEGIDRKVVEKQLGEKVGEVNFLLLPTPHNMEE